MSDLPNNLAVASAARLQPLTATLTVRDGVPFRGTISLVETLNGRYLSTWYRSVPASSEGKVQFEGRPSEFQLNIQDAQGVPIAVVPGGTLKPELTDVLLEKNMRMRLEHSVGTEQEESGLEIRYND